VLAFHKRIIMSLETEARIWLLPERATSQMTWVSHHQIHPNQKSTASTNGRFSHSFLWEASRIQERTQLEWPLSFAAPRWRPVLAFHKRIIMSLETEALQPMADLVTPSFGKLVASKTLDGHTGFIWDVALLSIKSFGCD
jgi:hypothetical protein